jgi:hypothetical protein
VLIDFGHSREIQNDDGTHIKREKNQPFIGNYIFASHNAFLNRTQSRRDDLISLCYLLVYLLDGEPQWVKGLAG